MSAFTWTPDFGASNNPKQSVIESRFGDGYSQRQQVGLNGSADVWSVTFGNRSADEAGQITDFLEARGGVEAFDWTPPGASYPARFICRSGNWSVTTVKFNLYSISAKFEQVFEP
jgi:phage-related protein